MDDPRYHEPSGALITAIIPNYNHGAIIGNAVRALAQQVPTPDEILVVDDGSTDDSPTRLDLLAREFPRLRVIRRSKNEGAINALNTGLAEARGTYVYFGAADDIVQPGLFATAIAAFSDHPGAAFACGEALVIDQQRGTRSDRPPARPVRRASFLPANQVADVLKQVDNWMITGAALLRRELVVKENGFDPKLDAFADGFLCRKLALLYGCCYIPQQLLIWQVSDSGYSRSMAADPDYSNRVLATALARMRSDPAFPAWYPGLFERRWRFAIGRLAAQSSPINLPVLSAISAERPCATSVMQALSALGGPLGRLAILTWLFLRERPMSLWAVVETASMRILERAFGRQAADMPRRNRGKADLEI